MEWNVVTDDKPDIGEGAVIGFNETWIHPDWNPKGVREVWRNRGNGADTEWISARWCDMHNEYHTITSDPDMDGINKYEENAAPTHYMLYPNPPISHEPNQK